MASRGDQHIRLADIQNKIRDYLGLKPENIVFEYNELEKNFRLDLITINPRHTQSFLFHSTEGTDKIEATEKMWSYVKSYRDEENSYTIQWKARGDNELQTSYFHAKNIYTALDKLYFGRDFNTITVFSVVLNPVS